MPVAPWQESLHPQCQKPSRVVVNEFLKSRIAWAVRTPRTWAGSLEAIGIAGHGKEWSAAVDIDDLALALKDGGSVEGAAYFLCRVGLLAE